MTDVPRATGTDAAVSYRGFALLTARTLGEQRMNLISS